MQLIRVANNKNGEGAKPNKIRVNLNSINPFSSKLLKVQSCNIDNKYMIAQHK